MITSFQEVGPYLLCDCILGTANSFIRKLLSENMPLKNITACYLHPAENFHPTLDIILVVSHKI